MPKQQLSNYKIHQIGIGIWDCMMRQYCCLINWNYPMAIKSEILSNMKKINDDSQLWWISDTLENIYEGFILTISFQDLKSFPEEFDFIVRFENAEVIRR